jgi:hypothetical protein
LEIDFDQEVNQIFRFLINVSETASEQNKKIFTKNWQRKLVEKHSIGTFLNVQYPKKRGNRYFIGFFETGIKFFIERNDLFEKRLDFQNILPKKFSKLPAKIIAIYPKILRAKIKIVPEKNIFLSSLKTKKSRIYEKKELNTQLFHSKFASKIKNFEILKKTDMEKLHRWILTQKVGEWFVWNIKKFYFLISFIVNPKKLLFFSFPIWIRIDRKTKKWIFIHKKNIFFNLNELFNVFIKPLRFFLSKRSIDVKFY